MTLMVTLRQKTFSIKPLVQSGTVLGRTSPTKEQTRSIGLAVLDELKISKNDIDKIADVPYGELMTA